VTVTAATVDKNKTIRKKDNRDNNRDTGGGTSKPKSRDGDGRGGAGNQNPQQQVFSSPKSPGHIGPCVLPPSPSLPESPGSAATRPRLLSSKAGRRPQFCSTKRHPLRGPGDPPSPCSSALDAYERVKERLRLCLSTLPWAVMATSSAGWRVSSPMRQATQIQPGRCPRRQVGMMTCDFKSGIL
jgi:hypothetical protein